MRLSRDFTLEELVYSATALRLGIDNTPTDQEEANLRRLATEVLQPLRDEWGRPIVVTSGYRCAALNKAVGGTSSSQHLRGEAADIRSLSGNPIANKALFATAVCMVRDKGIRVGQLIDEYGYSWIHISLSDGRHRNQVIHATHEFK